jgi:hypothetical protein
LRWLPAEPFAIHRFANAGEEAVEHPVTLVAGLVLMAIAVALMLATLPA